jgi:hypothetical protein
MKLHLALTLVTGATAFTSHSTARNGRFVTNLYASKGDENTVSRHAGGTVAFISGLFAAGQIAFADPMLIVDNTVDYGTCCSFFVFKTMVPYLSHR